ncbi:NAD(P)-dependent oxidoreductase [Paenibacillus sacheonensis]|uniref:NAD(P)H-binding protein n=1 Tax=Paenibacillus sacheonensis TaxID=742054 RepID=A0A7X5C4T7_9BACL|nr:NAD(P)H-binding protein [Paenibacillus sacheonensis]MBM7568916.1 putative NADH-flavin reductase [Paenibacillus sacheonensis]NBC72709.1 NAD(P)H-binding protein [Paenibacillus sacheonensis]
MKMVVFGAGGRTGRLVVQQALEQGHVVTAFLRASHRWDFAHAGLRLVRGDASDGEAAAAAIAGQDAVISCLGARRWERVAQLSRSAEHIIAGMQRHGVARISYLACAGIYGEIPGLSGIAARLLQRRVLADHRRAADALAASGLDWTIARPIRFSGWRLRGDYLEARQGIPSGKSRISRADTAHFLLRALKDPLYSHQSIGLSY